MPVAHIGAMDLIPPVRQPPVALLSAASPDGEASIALLPLAAGQIVLEEQTNNLRAIGVTRFLIEVDIVPGAILAFVDNLRKAGCAVDFVRTFADLRGKLSLKDRLLVQQEGIIASSKLLQMVADETSAVIATVDDREENTVFERMDINTRWSGIASLDPQILAATEDVPEEWSLDSSLLRTAMQRGTTMRLLRQGYLQQGDLRKICSQADADRYARQMLTNRVGNVDGVVESKLFAPLARIIAPAIWRAKAGAAMLSSGILVTSLGALGLGAYGFSAAACGTGILAAALQTVRTIAGRSSKSEQAIGALGWGLLGTALLTACWISGERAIVSLFAPAMSLGIIGVAYLSKLPIWARQVICSPALLAIMLLLLLGFTDIGNASSIAAIIQLSALLAASWQMRRNEAKSEQA